MTSLRDLLGDMEARGRTRAGTVDRAARALAREEEKAPWFLTLLMGAGAWLATLFFLIGAGSLLDFGGDWGGWALVAVVFLGLGLGAGRFSAHVFVAQFSLGLTLAGWSAGVVAGRELMNDDLLGSALVGIALAGFVYWLHAGAAARFFVSLAALVLLTLWFFVEFDGEVAIVRNTPAVLSVIGAGLLFWRPGLSRRLQPLGLAFAVTLALTLPFLSAELGSRREVVPSWPTVLALTLALVLLTWSLLAGVEAGLRRELQPLCLAAVVALGVACWFGGPGLLAAIFLLVLGHASALRALELLGLLALPSFLFLYYHDLHVPLLTKSGLVIASGLVLLLLRHVLSKRPWARELALESIVAGVAGALLLVVFAWSVVSKERVLRDGTTVLVPLGPRDPRSLMQGDYMVLRYAVPERILKGATQRAKRRGLLVVKLDREGRASFERIFEKGKELGPREHLLAYFWRGRQVDVGAPSFFFEEGAAGVYNSARFGELRVAATGASVLVGLRDEQLVPLGRPDETEPAEP